MLKKISKIVFCCAFFLMIQNLKAENSLSLYVITPPRKISWKSPSSLTWTAFKSAVKSDFHSIGHAMIHLQCDTTSTTPAVNEQTGATSLENPDDKDLLFKNGIGMGLLFYDFPGELNSYKYVSRQLEIASEMQNRLSTFKSLINESTCQRLSIYLKEYKEKRLDTHYGLSLKPRSTEGAGCTAFAASFFELAGLLSPEIKKSWSLSLNVQEKLIGDPILDQHVPLNDILFGEEGTAWAKGNEASRSLIVYDTQFFDQWIRKIWNMGSKKFPTGYSIDRTNYKQWHKKIWIEIQAPGTPNGWEEAYVSNGVVSLQFDARSIPTPQDNIWVQ
jgi:hypothetical protein